MARKRIELGADVERLIAEGVQRGETGQRIAATIGSKVSRSTIERRVRELRGPIRSPRSGAKPIERPPAPPRPILDASVFPETEEAPDALADKSLPELRELLDTCKKGLSKAEAEGNLPLVGQMIRVAAQLSETIRKATPPKQADPNDAPDMVALRVEARRRWIEMIDLVAVDAAELVIAYGADP